MIKNILISVSGNLIYYSLNTYTFYYKYISDFIDGNREVYFPKHFNNPSIIIKPCYVS